MKTILTLLLLLTITTTANAVEIYDKETGKYLGQLGGNQFAPDSTNNPYGRYGSQYSPDSINNPYGTYGSQYSNSSPNKTIKNRLITNPLTETWQTLHNSDYQDLQNKAKSSGDKNADYKNIEDKLINAEISILAENAGLDIPSYLRLMESPFIDECIRIITLGLKTISSK